MVRLRDDSRALYERAYADSLASADPRDAARDQNSASEMLAPFLHADVNGNERGPAGESNASATNRELSTRTGTPSTSKKSNLLSTKESVAQNDSASRGEAQVIDNTKGPAKESEQPTSEHVSSNRRDIQTCEWSLRPISVDGSNVSGYFVSRQAFRLVAFSPPLGAPDNLTES